MTCVQVWAPAAARVAVDVAGARTPLAPDSERPGWWRDQVPTLRHGTRYALAVDDREPTPDPLARWMPDGVHAPSAAWDESRVVWTDVDWAGRDLSDPRTVIYEIHVGTFTAAGTLDAAIDRLDHLVALGVTHAELMPLAAFDGDRGWGYDGVAINAVHESYGGPDALCRFVDAAHAAGVAVLLDVVHNHLGPSGNYWTSFGPFFTDAHVTPWGSAVNLDDAGSDDVRAILTASALGWLEDFHLDGLRLDAVHALRDDRAVGFLEALSVAAEELSGRLDRPLPVIAESDRNDPATVTPRDQGGDGLTAQWDDDVHHALHWLLTGETNGYYEDFGSCPAVAHALTRGFLHDGQWSSFRGREHGRPIDFEVTPPWRFVTALQTHDQVGNRAQGDRLSHLVPADRLAAGAALLLTLPYTPMLFMGEEWGASTPWQFFTSFHDAELGTAVTDGRRREFAAYGWDVADVPDPQAASTFEASKLRWEERDEGEHPALLAWYRSLIALRTDRTALSSVDCAWDQRPDGRPLWFAVRCGDQTTVSSFADEPVVVEGLAAPELLLAWRHGATLLEDGRVQLAAGATAVLSARRSRRRKDIS